MALYIYTMTLKGRLLSEPPMLKLFLGKNSTVEIRPKMAVLGGKGGVNVKFWFCDPENAHPCAEPCLLTYFTSMSVVTSWLMKNPNK